MANTTNFNWETPDDTDLVKDGAAAIRTLGSAIDTSLVDLKGGTTGQVLSKATNTDMDFTWVAQDDSNAIQNAIIDAKGDLIVGTAADTPARLASSASNGDVLTVDTSTASGLKWAAVAGGGFTFQTWTPTYTNLTIGNGTVTARYGTSGKFTYFEWTLTFGSTTSISGSPEITLPTTPKNTGYSMWQGNIGYLDAGTNIYFGHLNIVPATSKVVLYVDRANQTHLEYAGIDATTPFTWTTNDRISVSGQYEEA